MPEGVVAVGKGRVGPDQCNCGRYQQNDAAQGLDLQEALESCEGTLGQKLGSRKFIGMIHGAHAFRVAARPSLDLSLLHAANTRMLFYTTTAKRQTVGLPICRRNDWVD